MKTQDNLKDAFAGESQANRRYLAFAKKADQDGFAQVAKLFRAAAAAETVHALSHFRAMGGIGPTLDNLKAAKAGENHEAVSMYPGFLATAKEEKVRAAEVTFGNALAVEKVHEQLYGAAVASVERGKDLVPQAIYVCDVCGYTVEGTLPDECPVCGTTSDKFTEIF